MELRAKAGDHRARNSALATIEQEPGRRVAA